MESDKADKADVFKRVVAIIKRMLQSSRGENEAAEFAINAQTDIFSDLGIDSVEVMDLLCYVESEFNITIDTEKAAAKRTVGDLSELVCSHLAM